MARIISATVYEYDNLNQLVRVNDERAGKTYTYSYSNGNITEKKNMHSQQENWEKQLKHYRGDMKTIHGEICLPIITVMMLHTMK